MTRMTKSLRYGWLEERKVARSYLSVDSNGEKTAGEVAVAPKATDHVHSVVIGLVILSFAC